MSGASLIEVNQLKDLLDAKAPILLFDCRFDLVDSDAGYQSYLEGHIPGAIYVHSDKDLATTKNGKNGRHPLPSMSEWEKTYANLGITPNKQVVIYDNQGGMYAARLWWMLQATGHHLVSILNGGFGAWKNLGLPVSTSETHRQAVAITSLQPYKNLVLVDAVLKNLENKTFTILDARANDRFHGENEVLDPVGGHIPGALNRCFKDNLDSAGKFKSIETLRHEFGTLLGDQPSSKIVHQCGSGITACHNLFAMELANHSGSSVYAGSWSEWCADSSRPVER